MKRMKLGILLGICISICCSILLVSLNVYAYAFLNGYKRSGTSYPINVNYYFGRTVTSATIQGYYTSAASSWNNSQSKIKYTYSSSGETIFDIYYLASTSEYGYTSNTFGSQYIIASHSYFNTGNPNYTLTNYGQSVCCHELGHEIGLADDNSNTNRIMSQLRNRGTVYTPQSDDLTGVNTLYN